MKERILNYRLRVDNLIKTGDSEIDWESVRDEHLAQISFFQHERLVHWLVTMLVAILTFIAVGIYIVSGAIYVLALVGILLVLLVPYILHYYLLENETQKMYDQYDKILEIIRDNRDGWASIGD